MSKEEKSLQEIKGYVARLYGIVRTRSHEESSDTETIEEINTNLQIANSFQQEEIYTKLCDVETLLQQLLNVVPEKFEKVDEWMAMGLGTGHNGVGDVIAFVIEESEKSYKIKSTYIINTWRGHGWARRAYEPMLMAGDLETEVIWEKSKVLSYYKPTEERLKEFLNSASLALGYDVMPDPWKTKLSIETAMKTKGNT